MSSAVTDRVIEAFDAMEMELIATNLSADDERQLHEASQED
jgi:uncharacterized membrane protein